MQGVCLTRTHTHTAVVSLSDLLFMVRSLFLCVLISMCRPTTLLCRSHLFGHRGRHTPEDSARRAHAGHGRGRDVRRGGGVDFANGQAVDFQRVGLHRTAGILRARGQNGGLIPSSYDLLRKFTLSSLYRVAFFVHWSTDDMLAEIVFRSMENRRLT